MGQLLLLLLLLAGKGSTSPRRLQEQQGVGRLVVVAHPEEALASVYVPSFTRHVKQQLHVEKQQEQKQRGPNFVDFDSGTYSYTYMVK